MKYICFMILALPSNRASGQLVNGSFEIGDDLSAEGWTVPCQNAWIGTGMIGEGDRSLILPYGTTSGPCYASKAYQLVPAITNGSTWTLSGWCHLQSGGSTLPLIGIGMGIKHSDGWWEYFTAPVMNTYDWTDLSVTNTFTMEPEDTAFVVCEAGVVSGSGSGGSAEFDGLELTDLSTGLVTPMGSASAAYPNPAQDRIRIPLTDALVSLQVFDGTGRICTAPTSRHTDRSVDVDLSSVPAGSIVIKMDTPSGTRTVRLLKT